MTALRRSSLVCSRNYIKVHGSKEQQERSIREQEKQERQMVRACRIQGELGFCLESMGRH